MLTLKNIKKKYSKKVVINHLNLELEHGVYGLVGSNGAGKTTLLNIICGLTKPSNGRIFYEGQDIVADRSVLLDRLGYLPQDFSYYPNFSAMDFLRYMGILKGVTKNLDKECRRLLNLVGLDKKSDVKIKSFSGGMKQRLGIAQSLLNDPEILVLDEPTVGLDPKERIRFRNLISALGKEKIVILSTHIVGDIESIANEIFILKSGEITDRGDIAYFLDKLKGKVWEVAVDAVTAENLKSEFVISNQKATDNQILLRIVSDLKPTKDAKLISPNFEDVYLYYFPNQGEN